MELGGSAAKVQDEARRLALDVTVREMPASTRTAEEAAAACGVTVGQIVKSLVFLGAQSGKPYLLLVSGTNRVNETGVAAHLGEGVTRPDGRSVREMTGFAIGGIPPFGMTRRSPPSWIGICCNTTWSGRGRNAESGVLRRSEKAARCRAGDSDRRRLSSARSQLTPAVRSASNARVPQSFRPAVRVTCVSVRSAARQCAPTRRAAARDEQRVIPSGTGKARDNSCGRDHGNAVSQ